jgi:hypothetical protein
MTRSTHTLATLQVLPSTYAEIRDRLTRGGYDVELPLTGLLDLSGFALEARPERISSVHDDIEKKLRTDYYYDPITESHVSAWFKRDALQHVGLDDHPKADEIFAFASTVGMMAQTDMAANTLRALQQIAAFML